MRVSVSEALSGLPGKREKLRDAELESVSVTSFERGDTVSDFVR